MLINITNKKIQKAKKNEKIQDGCHNTLEYMDITHLPFDGRSSHKKNERR